MAETFDPAPGAAGFQTSTPSILTLASLLGSLQTFLSLGKEEASQQETPASTVTAMKKLQRKSRLMTAYLLLLLRSSSFFVPMKDVAQFEAEQAKSGVHKPGFTVITPEHPDHRGAQLSILLLPRNKGMLPLVMEALMRVGVYGDEREPDVIRFAPVPLYNTFRDCWMAYRSLQWAVDVSVRRAVSCVACAERDPDIDWLNLSISVRRLNPTKYTSGDICSRRRQRRREPAAHAALLMKS